MTGFINLQKQGSVFLFVFAFFFFGGGGGGGGGGWEIAPKFEQLQTANIFTMVRCELLSIF